MTASDHSPAGPEAHGERERIRALLLSGRPDLSRRLQTGPSGALLIPLPGAGGIEIGRMRRRGRARWVVVAREGDRTRVREPATVAAVADTALAALACHDQGPTPRPIDSRASC